METGFEKGVDNFTFQNIELGTDYEGTVEATLIRFNKLVKNGIPVLYIHGFSDYFFHPHMAKKFHEAGYNFFALELRKYGNSIRAHQHPNYCRSLFEYFPEIDQALEIITKKNTQKAILLGHSNGGLISSLYTKSGKNRNLIQLLILNSPFLDLGLNPLVRMLGIPILGALARVFPYAKINNVVNQLYPKSLDKKYYGEWEINNNWKPLNGFPGYFSWLQAVSKAQDIVARNDQIKIPILFLHSSDSHSPKVWDERIMESDIILDVKKVRNKALKLGIDLTFLEIDKAMHDIFLSKKKVREEAFSQMFKWLDKRVMDDE